MNRPTRRFTLLAVLLLAPFLPGCKGDSPTDPTPKAQGTYTLKTVNATALPAVIFQSADGRIEIISGTTVLRADNSYTETLQARVIYTSGGSETTPLVESGTYSVTGSTVTFTVPANAGEPSFSYTGAVSGRTLTYTYDGLSFTYER